MCQHRSRQLLPRLAWGLAVVWLTSSILFIASETCVVGYASRYGGIGLERGELFVWMGNPTTQAEGFIHEPISSSSDYRLPINWHRYLSLPLILLALAGFASDSVCLAWWFVRQRRIPPHCCQKCGYDLTGNTSGTCPECGAATPQATPGEHRP
jgi:hypothetical protein